MKSMEEFSVILDNKLGITDSVELAREEERISKRRHLHYLKQDFSTPLKLEPIKD